jgi:hypothetical protein
MRNVDEILSRALREDERDLLASLPEPGLLGASFGLFRGRLGWVNAVVMVVQGAAFLTGAYAAWRFFGAADTYTQLRWGLPAATLLLVSLILKAMLWPAVQADRVIREVKRLELRLAGAAERQG